MDAEDTTTSGTTLPPSTTRAGSLGPRMSLLIYHRDGSLMVPLRPGQTLTIGRARPADVALRDPSLSRPHARFWLEGDVLWVEDLGSTNGTKVHDRRVKRARVSTGDEVRLGSVAVAFHALGPNEPPTGRLEGHDRFVTRLEDEVVRARTLGRSLAVLMVRSAKRGQGRLSRWARRVGDLLRPVDLAALYDPGALLLYLVEGDASAAQALAQRIIEGRQRGEPPLVCGISLYPAHAASSEALIESAILAARQASMRKPIFVPTSRHPLQAKRSEPGPVIINEQMQALYATVQRIVDSTLPVLICGETGSGKEVLARTIHVRGRGRRAPLRCINCASIPEPLVESTLFGHERGAFTDASRRAKGVFEEADGGTVLLDEIGELSPSAQAKLLRAIETKRVSRVGSSREFGVDVRVLAATHRDLEQMCEAGQFRWDLYYRISTIVLRIPPLRERPEEILPLAEKFIQLANRASKSKVMRIDRKAQHLLCSYDWPGNVRELRNVIERAVVLANKGTITVDELSERVRRQAAPQPTPASDRDLSQLDIKARLREYETQLLRDALQAHSWNQTHTAEALGMPLRTLAHKIRTLDIRKPDGGD